MHWQPPPAFLYFDRLRRSVANTDVTAHLKKTVLFVAIPGILHQIFLIIETTETQQKDYIWNSVVRVSPQYHLLPASCHRNAEL